MSQTSIEIYVRSSPLGSQGIHWRNISKDGQPVEEPDALKSRIILKDNGKKATINSLINDTKPSVVLARYDDKILLEVTGLEASKERSSQLGRRITEVVLWVGDDLPDVESQLRKLSTCAMLSLWDKNSAFLKIIREAIRFKDLNDFEVDQVAIKQLYNQTAIHLRTLSQTASYQSASSIWSIEETIDTDEHLQSLAHQIIQSVLPETKQPVVVVAEIKNERFVYRGNIWKAPNQFAAVPVPLPEEFDTQPEKKTPSVPPETTPIPATRIVILGIVLAIAVLVIALTILQRKSPVETTPSLLIPLKPTPTEIVTPKPARPPTSKPQTTPLKPTPTEMTPSLLIPLKPTPTEIVTPKPLSSPKVTQLKKDDL